MVTVTVVGSGSSFCGETSVDGNGRPTVVVISEASLSACNNKNTGSLTAAITHELAHVLGYGTGHGGSDARGASFTLNCATFLPKIGEGRFIPSGICHHEVEPIFRAYALETLESDFYSRPMIVGTDVNPIYIDSLAPSTTVQLSLSGWRTNDPGTSNPSRSWSDHNVSSSHSTRASVNSAGLVTGVGAGTAFVRVVPTAAAPSGFTMWSPFRVIGDSVEVRVKPPTALPLQVTAITFTESPVVTAGGHTATAVLSDPGAQGTVSWKMVSSLATGDTTFSTGPTMSFSVPGAASYQLTFIARIGSFDTQQVVHVCTTEGGETEAVEGC